MRPEPLAGDQLTPDDPVVAVDEEFEEAQLVRRHYLEGERFDPRTGLGGFEIGESAIR